jgi:hypothetical protein
MQFPEERHPAYDHINAKENAKKRHGTQAGDPKKGAQAMYKLALLEDPPLRAVIGSDAYQGMLSKLKTYAANVEKYKDIANSTDVDE